MSRRRKDPGIPNGHSASAGNGAHHDGADGNGENRMKKFAAPRAQQPPLVLITGGAGFVGINLADELLRQGFRVRILDNLCRPGVRENLLWLNRQHRTNLEFDLGDVRDPHHVERAVEGADQVYHFAAQVAVTSSLSDPAHDLDVNIRGTFNVLEAIRKSPRRPSLLFTSTNKVYGDLGDCPVQANGTRYLPAAGSELVRGIGETRPLQFYSPYGCSKGAADQYVLDYARVYDLPAVVFRMSCIYGPHQCGTEDQGWVAHFLIRALSGDPITIYGDGRQVRDVLYARDLVRAMQLAQLHLPEISGQAFNIGGGGQNTLSLLELIALIEELQGRRPEIRLQPWRPGDQKYYVSDIRRFSRATGWRPRFNVKSGVAALHRWLTRHESPPKTPATKASYEYAR